MLTLIDGFDYMPTGAVQLQAEAFGWTGSTNGIGIATDTAFGQGKCMALGANENVLMVNRNINTRVTTTGVWGFRLKIPASNGPSWYCGVRDTKTVDEKAQTRIQFDYNGCISIYYWSAGINNWVLMDRSKPGSFVPDRWFYFDMKTKVHASTGTTECRVNTVPVVSIPAGNNTAGTLIGGYSPGYDLVWFELDGPNSGDGGGGNWRWDDMYFLDDTGAANTTYLGNVKVPCQLPVSNSTPLDWLIGGSAPAATNWQSVLNTALDDTKYVYSPTVGNRDLYTIQAIINAPLVYGVQVSGAFRQDDATQRVVHNTIQSAGVDSEGIDHYTNQSYTFYSDIWETDPATGVGFTGAALNVLEIGPKVIV